MTKVLLATSEAVPLAKTGGLADVCGALPMAMQREGCDMTLILPAYQVAQRELLESGTPFTQPPIPLEIPIGTKTVPGRLQVTTLPNTNIRTILVEQPQYFDRPQLYTEHGADYRDNCERFVFFSRAVIESIRLLKLDIDLIHCNDWQTALVPAYLENEYRDVPGYERLATLMTIHNLAYQGRFWHWDMLLTGLDWKLFNWRQLEFFGDLNFLKGGIVFATGISTVSPRYAQEIQTPEFGCGLEGALRARQRHLTGILNGADYGAWDPEVDPHLEVKYSARHWEAGKGANKAALQKEAGLPAKPDVPLVGFVGRLTEQKGVDLLTKLIAAKAPSSDIQWIVLGTGDPQCEQALRSLAAEFPQRVATRIAFSDALAHRIIAGSDIFFMPSRFEPCGLTQFYSLKYGTLPLVHATGGLYDSICESPREGQPQNGFVFTKFTPGDCEWALNRAMTMYGDAPESWRQIVNSAMRQDWSWSHSAKKYAALYKQTIARARQSVFV
jgi:starch synthase